MILIEPEQFDKLQESDSLGIKFVAIGDDVCAIALLKMMKSDHFYKVERRPLPLTQEYIDCLPPATRSIDHITPASLMSLPVIMLESPIEDGRYVRIDGRHRILGAWKRGMRLVPALWFPRDIWSKFIVGYRIEGQCIISGDDGGVTCDALPYIWNRTPLVPSGIDRHHEMNFELPIRWA